MGVSGAKNLPKIARLEDACCGCGACASQCPKGCIQLKPDAFGFRKPKIDASQCVQCGACDRVCPSINKKKKDECVSVAWAKSNDMHLLNQSSSGGIFGLLAKNTLQCGGMVVGAGWSSDFHDLRHVVVHDFAQLPSLYRSKYLQSRIEKDVYRQMKSALRQQRSVLFVGTACQVAGITNYLGDMADSELFLGVEVICHGVPSPLLWDQWLCHLEEEYQGNATDINFRSKETGWSTYSVVYRFSDERSGDERRILINHNRDWYMRAFLSDMSLRPSCYQCPSKRSSGSDITLGDYWGIQEHHPEVDCSAGVSAVICNTAKGKRAVDSLRDLIDCDASSFESVARGNPSLVRAVSRPSARDEFMNDLASGIPINQIVEQWSFESRGLRSKLGKLKSLVKKLIS